MLCSRLEIHIVCLHYLQLLNTFFFLNEENKAEKKKPNSLLWCTQNSLNICCPYIWITLINMFSYNPDQNVLLKSPKIKQN